MMNKKISLCVVVTASVLMLTTSSCGHRQERAKVEATAEKVETIEEGATPDTLADEMQPQDEAKTHNGYPSTYEEPKGKVLEVLKDYNAHMTDYNTTGVEALGMGYQGNRVLVNYSVTDISFDLKNKTKLKTQVCKLIETMPISEKVAWRCIPDEGHDLMVTLVGRQSNKIVSVVFTKEELKDILY